MQADATAAVNTPTKGTTSQSAVQASQTLQSQDNSSQEQATKPASSAAATTTTQTLNVQSAASDATTSNLEENKAATSQENSASDSLPDPADPANMPGMRNYQTVCATFSSISVFYSGKNNFTTGNYHPSYSTQNGDPFSELPKQLQNDLAKEFNSDDFIITRQGDSSNQSVDLIAVGTYNVTLKPEKITELQNLFNKYTVEGNQILKLIFQNNASFTYTVKAAKAYISIDHVGQTSSSTDMDINNYKPVITVQEGDNADQPTIVALPDTVKLTKADYKLSQTSQGQYTVSLTDQAVRKIEEAIDPDGNRYNGQSN